MPTRFAALCLALLLLPGCQTLRLASGPEAPPLVSPQQGMASLQLSQRLTIRMPDGETRQMLAITTLAPDRMQLNGLSVTGQRLLEIRWDGESLETWQVESLDETLPARWLLAQIQLAYLPVPVLHRYYTGNWSLQTDTGKRYLLLEGESNITVTCRAPIPGKRPDGEPGAQHGASGCLAPGTSVLIDHHRSGLFIRVDTLKVVEQGLNGNTSGISSATVFLTAGWPERSRP